MQLPTPRLQKLKDPHPGLCGSCHCTQSAYFKNCLSDFGGGLGGGEVLPWRPIHWLLLIITWESTARQDQALAFPASPRVWLSSKG